MKEIIDSLAAAGYDYGVAIATKAEIEAGAACNASRLINVFEATIVYYGGFIRYEVILCESTL